MPSASIGVQGSPGTHCEPQPRQAKRSSGAGVRRHAHSERHACTARSAPTPSVCRPPRAPAVPGEAAPGGQVRLTAWVHGHVQGVGFRWWTRARALELGLVGSATNHADGRVLVVAEGPRAPAEALLVALRGAGTPGRVDTVVESWGAARGGLRGFVER